MNVHAAVVLAAGGSRRLGHPKQLLTQGGEPLLRRCARLALATGPKRLVVVLGANADRMRETVRDLPLEIALNPDWAEGMAGSLQAAAARIAGFERVLVLGCDQPALSNEHLSALLDGAGRIRSGCAATLTGGVRGIPAVVPGGWFLEATPTPDAGFRTRLRALPAPDIHLLQAPELAWDIDTPAQLATARAGGLVDP